MVSPILVGEIVSECKEALEDEIYTFRVDIESYVKKYPSMCEFENDIEDYIPIEVDTWIITDDLYLECKISNIEMEEYHKRKEPMYLEAEQEVEYFKSQYMKDKGIY